MVRRWLAAGIAAGVLGFGAESAGATTYCVDTPPGCSGTNVTGSAGFASALSSAQGTSTPDRIELAASTYSQAGGFSYAGGAGNTLELLGQGIGQTFVASTTSSASLVVNGGNSVVSDLTVKLAPVSSPIGLSVLQAGTEARRVAAIDQSGTSSGEALKVSNGATVRDSSVTESHNGLLYGVTAGSGAGHALDMVIDGPSYGIYGPTDIHRVTIRNSGTGIYANGSAAFKIDQAVVFVPGAGKGIEAATTTATDVVATVDHVTVVGPGDASSTGVSARATHGGATKHNATLILRSGIVRGVAHATALHASNGATTLQIDHSDYDPANQITDLTLAGTGSVIDQGANVNVDPLFLGADDFHLQGGSPVIDAGQADVQASESSTDRDGNVRDVDGNGDGGAETDMGAFEFQPPPGTGPSPVTVCACPLLLVRRISARISGARVPVDARGRGRLPARCTGTGSRCSFAGSLSALASSTRKPARRRTVGRVRGTLTVGRSGKLALRLNRIGRHALHSHHRLRTRLTGTLRGSDGASRRVLVSVLVVPKPVRRRR